MWKRLFRIPTPAVWLAVLALFAAQVHRASAITVHFDKDVYIVSGPGEEIVAHILIDADPAVDGDQPIPVGLYSYGVKMSFNPTKGDVDSLTDVVVPSEMDYFGLNPGALVGIAPPGEVAVHANVNQDITMDLEGYDGVLLFTVTLTNLASAVDSYPLLLDFSRDLGINEDFFVDHNGTTLDPSIMFISSRVLVIPEPSTAALALFSLLSLAAWRRFRRPR
jgi:hypothetical protein